MHRCIKNILVSDSLRSCLLVLVIATVILLIRKTDSFLNPQFWAEDGVVFFLQQYERGASAIFQPYSGYLHLVPRLIASFADTFFNYSAIPFVYNYLSLIVTLIVVASIFSPRLKIDHKPLLALTVVLVPHSSNELFMNITNIQWFLSILLIIVLMKENPNSDYGSINIQRASDFMVIILCGLTGPFIILLTPFFAWKWLKDQDLYHFSVMSTAIAISLIQLSFLLFIPKQPQANSLALDFDAYSAIVGYKVFGSLFFRKIATYKPSHYFLSVMYFGLIFMILRFSSLKNNFIVFALGIQLMFLSAAFYKFRANPEVLIPAGDSQRYFYIPFIMLIWSLIALLGKQEKWKDAVITVVLSVILISSLTSGFHSLGFVDYNWKLYSKAIGNEDVIIPINPEGWQIHIKANPK